MTDLNPYFANSCQFCQGNQTPIDLIDPEKIVYGRTCSEWQELAYTNNTNPVPCGEFEFVGALCGCSNEPSHLGCQVCPGGASVEQSRAGRDLPDFGFFGTNITVNCSVSRLMAQYTYPADSIFCPVQQSVMASFCGCPTPNEMICPLCQEEGEEVSGTKMSPQFTFETASKNVTESKYSCLDAEYVANVPGYMTDAACEQTRQQVSKGCCVREVTVIDTPTSSPVSGAHGSSAMFLTWILLAMSCVGLRMMGGSAM
jgi:hypothetical protein